MSSYERDKEVKSTCGEKMKMHWEIGNFFLVGQNSTVFFLICFVKEDEDSKVFASLISLSVWGAETKRGIRRRLWAPGGTMRDVKPSLTWGHRLWFPLDPSCHHPVLYSTSPSLPPLFSGSHQLSISTLSSVITHGRGSESLHVFVLVQVHQSFHTFHVFYYI